MNKAEIQHLVRLIQHELAGLRKINRPPLHQVDETARRRHQNIRAPAKRLDLPEDRLPAHNGRNFQLRALAQVAQARGDLVHQFPRRRQHQRLRRLGVRLARLVQKVVDQRQAKCQRLARARLREAEHIMPVQRKRDRLVLDRRRLGKATRLKGLVKSRVEAQHVEIKHVSSLIGRTGKSPGAARNAAATCSQVRVRTASKICERISHHLAVASGTLRDGELNFVLLMASASGGAAYSRGSAATRPTWSIPPHLSRLCKRTARWLRHQRRCANRGELHARRMSDGCHTDVRRVVHRG